MDKVKAIYNAIINFLLRIKLSFPTKLPQGVQEFEAWASQIIKAYGMPDNDSVRFAIASSILHLSSTDSHRPPAYFGKVLVKGAASQVALGVMEDLKNKQKAAQAAATAEATAVTPESVTSDATPKA